MKRKVTRARKLRLSPNEEALLVKEEIERRRKLRLQQVREQERYIALQIRQEVKQRRDEQLEQLADQLKAEWKLAQAEKSKALEMLFLSSLKVVGEGHLQAKEHEVDLETLAKQMVVSKQKAEERHREALKELKHQREKQLEEKTRHIKARHQALLAEKERAAKIASLPPPPPDPLENIEVKKYSAVKMYDIDSFSFTHYHLPETYVDKEMNAEQPNAQLAAEKEAQRLDELQKEEEREKREQLEKAKLRGSHALKKVHLAQDRQRLLTELEYLQHNDLARRRRIVAQMPPQLFEPPYRREEIKEDWQREMEFAFEDMYTGARNMKGDVVLCLKPEPLSAVSVGTQDEDLDISLEPEATQDVENAPEPAPAMSHPSPSKQALKKLLNKIRTQRDQWTSRSESENMSEAMTIESGSITSEEMQWKLPKESLTNQIEQNILVCEKEHKYFEGELEDTVVAGTETLLHPKEQASKIRSAAERRKWIEEIEEQKQQQLALLQQLEEQKQNLETYVHQTPIQEDLIDLEKEAQHTQGEQSRMEPTLEQKLVKSLVPKAKELESRMSSIQEVPEMVTQPAVLSTEGEDTSAHTNGASQEHEHLKMIHQCQQRLLEQNRLHKQSIDEARRRLQDYQNLLKKRYLSASASLELDSNSRQKNPVATPFLQLQAIEPFYTSTVPKTFKTITPTTENDLMQSVHLSRSFQPTALSSVDPVHSTKLLLPATAKQTFVPVERSYKSEKEECRNQEQREQLLKGQIDFSLTQTANKFGRQQQDSQSNLMGLREMSASESTSSRERTLGPEIVLQDNQIHTGISPQTLFLAPQPEVDQLIQFKIPSTDGPEETLENQVKQVDVSGGQLRSMHLFSPVPSKISDLQIDEKQIESSKPSDYTLRSSELNNSRVIQQRFSDTNEESKMQERIIGMGRPSHLLVIQQMPSESVQESLKHQERPEELGRTRHFEASSTQEMLASLVHQECYELSQAESPVPGSYQSQLILKGPATSFLQNSEALQAQERLLASSVEIQARQDQLKDLQLQLDRQREALLSRQKIREDLLIYKQNQLKEQMQKQQKALDNLTRNTLEQCDASVDTQAEQFNLMSTLLKVLEDSERGSLVGQQQHECGLLQDTEENQSVLRHFQASGQSGKADLHFKLILTSLSWIHYRCYTGINLMHSKCIHLTGDTSDMKKDFSVIGDDQESSRLSNTQSPQEIDLSRISISSKDLSCSESTRDTSRSGGITWRERLMLEHLSLPGRDPSIPSTTEDSGLPSYSAAVGRSAATYSGPGLTMHKLNNKELYARAWSNTPEPSPLHNPVDTGGLSSTSLSTGSFSTKEQSDFSSVCTDDSALGANSRQGKYSKSDSSLTSSPVSSLGYRGARETTLVDTLPASAVEEYSQNGSRIHQIINKYTRDLSHSLDPGSSFFVPTARLDVSDLGDPNFHHPLRFSQQNTSQSFHSLDPVPDYDVLPSSSLPSEKQESFQDNRSIFKQYDQNSDNSIESFQSTPGDEHRGFSGAQEKETSQLYETAVPQASDSFHPLQPEVSISDYSLSTGHQTVTSLISQKSSEENTESQASLSSSNDQLPSDRRSVEMMLGFFSREGNSLSLHSSSFFLEARKRQNSQTDLEDSESFHTLAAVHSTTNDSVLTEYPITCSRELNEEVVSFAELPVVKLNKQNAPEQQIVASGKTIVTSAENTVGPEIGRYTEEHQLLEPETQPEVHSLVNSEISDGTIQASAPQCASRLETPEQTHSTSAFTTSSGTCASLYSIPVWELESRTGIMEEPELTLISSNDTTLEEPELMDTKGKEMLENRTDNLACMSEQPKCKIGLKENEFQASLAETANSVNTQFSFTATDDHLDVEDASLQQSAVMVLQYESSSGNLQESFLKKKGHFIQKSCKRVEEIKKEERPKKSQSFRSEVENAAASIEVGWLKKAGQVRVCTTEDKKTAEMEMFQRTRRLYNQLDEVKYKREEKMRQETYAMNREKAKEFQKKTLDKLRTKKM
nr:PREDICTED: centrosomal protein of 295 kDa [Latimeria chalumnae]|eukprot:XP_014354082.1 PREDICTED: centrosomal protein of 295 kDa [Latimeria chalumnae]